jgi:NAD(P)-dependent dehydrogenase (short-subunit alcohol dehydrogenase family)
VPPAGLVEGKAALVTGAASGIGRATARLLAREGARVLVCDVDDAGGRAAAAEIEAAGGSARFARIDVASESEVEAAVASALSAFGRLDCAVNSAGITGAPASLDRVDLEDFSRTLAVNLTGVFLCMKHEIAAMVRQGGGAIVNVASGAGLVAVPTLGPYCATKHGVLGLTKTAAVENARTGVRVNAVCPGSVDTPMLRASIAEAPAMEKIFLASQPGGRFGRAEEIAEAVVWLCSDRASFVSGESMLVDAAAVAR